MAHGETVDTLKYSFDEGLCWQEYKFVETAITITGNIFSFLIGYQNLFRIDCGARGKSN